MWDKPNRSCIGRAVGILKSKLGRKSCVKRALEAMEEIPFRRNKCFVGREKELMEMEATLFASNDAMDADQASKRSLCELPDGYGDDECEAVEGKSRFINLEVRCKEPTLEACIDPVIEAGANKGRSLQKQRSKHKRSKNGGGGKVGAGVVCVNGSFGVGKTELALEFAHRCSQRYKMVVWVGGEARYLCQIILNLSINLGLDVSAEAERERGRMRSFEEQEHDAFQRVKRELFRDAPYLLIENLETEEEWWEGKDLHDLIPRNTGATHVIITTRLPMVMSFVPMRLAALSMADSMVLIKGKRKDYSAQEFGVLKKFDERLSRSSFGISFGNITITITSSN